MANKILVFLLVITLIVTAVVNFKDAKSGWNAAGSEVSGEIVPETPQGSSEPLAAEVRKQFWRRGQILSASVNTQLIYDPTLHRDDPKYARELDRQLTIYDARALLRAADPLVQSGALQVFQVISNHFGEEVALNQLRSTYCELAGIHFFRERMIKAEMRLRSELTTSDEELKDSISAEELYVKKTIAFSKARLSMVLGSPSDSFFEALYSVKVERPINNPREDRLEPGQPILAADEDSP